MNGPRRLRLVQGSRNVGCRNAVEEPSEPVKLAMAALSELNEAVGLLNDLLEQLCDAPGDRRS
jgi:hypothetical protein